MAQCNEWYLPAEPSANASDGSTGQLLMWNRHNTPMHEAATKFHVIDVCAWIRGPEVCAIQNEHIPAHRTQQAGGSVSCA